MLLVYFLSVSLSSIEYEPCEDKGPVVEFPAFCPRPHGIQLISNIYLLNKGN